MRLVQRKLTAKDKKLQYIWQQIEYWLQFRFNNPIQVEVSTYTGLTRNQHVYSLTVIREGKYYVYVDNKYLIDAKTDDLLDIIGREAIKVDLFSKGINAKETDAVYVSKLKEFKLPYYGIFPQEGMDLWEYNCLGCKKNIAITTKRIPESKGFAYNPKKLTSCCKKMIKEEGKRRFTNAECQKIHGILTNNGVDD